MTPVEPILTGARFIGASINIAGVILGEGEVVAVDTGVATICRNDAGRALAPESEVRRYLEDWPFMFEPVTQSSEGEPAQEPEAEQPVADEDEPEPVEVAPVVADEPAAKPATQTADKRSRRQKEATNG